LNLYRDQHSSFQRNDQHWTRAEELAGRQDPTQLGRVLEELGMQALLVGPQAAQNPCLRGTASSVRAWLLVLVFKFEQPSSCGGNVGVAVLWRRHFHRSLPIPNGYGGEVSLQL
jgi:hypothetical protein